MKNRTAIFFTSFFAIAIFCCQYTFAQDVTVVQGKVVDKKTKAPIEHVSVTEIDKDGRIIKGVSTNIDGNFALKISNPKGRISVSFIGFKPFVQDIRNRANINVSLEEASSDLDEVVITVQKKTDNGQLPIADRDLTTATAKISAKDLEEMQAASIDQALQGRLSGVDIIANSGDPGAGMSIRIRGTSSISASSNPLIVVDGMPYETAIPSDFNFGTADDQGYAQLLNIAPSDIKEISVLKDAAATAVWGSRAANGVLIITTKRGSVSKPVLSYTLRTTVSKQPDAIPLLNGNQYSTLIPEEVMNKTGAPLSRFAYPELAYDPSNPYYYYNYGQNTNWLNAITQIATTADNNLSLTGGGEKARYFVSLGYLNQGGTTIGTNLSRISTRINLDYVVSEKLRFRTDVAYTYTDNPKSFSPSIPGQSAAAIAAQDIRNVAINKMPNMSIYEFNERGQQTPNYFSPASNIQGQYPNTYNPVALANAASNRLLTNRVTPHFNLEYTITPQILKLTGDLQFDISSNKNKNFLPQIATGRPFTETTVNRAYDGDLDVFNVQSKTNLVYTPKLPKDHSLIGLVSVLTYDNKTVSYQALTSNTASSDLQDPSVPSRTANSDLNVGATYAQTRTIGALINMQYGYKDKYILNGGLRGDGNSRFGPNHRYGLFPSISTRWRVSGENFMKPYKWINDLSLRASYGQSGNAPTKDYTFYNLYSTYANNYAGLAGTYPSSIELNNLKWEVVHGTNLGVNLIMLKNRVNLDMEFYKNRTTDLMFPNLSISTYNGYSGVNLNVGTLDNQGWEFNAMTTPYKSKNWIVDFNFNISHNENVIRAISPYYPQTKGNLNAGGQYLTLLQVNNPFGSFYGYKYKGVYKDAASTVAKDEKGAPIIGPNGQPVQMKFNYPTDGYSFQAGDAMYEDINHDGNIDSRDVVYLGNSNPKYSGGFGPTITFKNNLKISAFFNFRSGYQIINGTKITTTNMNGFNNQSSAVLRRWRNPGDVTDIPRAVYAQPYNWLGSDRYVEDASFLRFRTVTARYNFLPKSLEKIKFKSMSVYVTIENIFTLTKYTGQDPEVSTSGQGALTTVVDNSTTPPVKMITLGLSAAF